MTKREFWLKYFSENDKALATAIRLYEELATVEGFWNNKELTASEEAELNEEMSIEDIETVLGNQEQNNEKLLEKILKSENTKKLVLTSANTVFVGDNAIVIPMFSRQETDNGKIYSAKEAIAVLDKSIAEITSLLNMIKRQEKLYQNAWITERRGNYINELAHLSNAYFKLFSREKFLEQLFGSNSNETTYTKEELEAYKKKLREVRKGLRRLYKRFRFFFGSDSGNVMRAIELKEAPLTDERRSLKEIELNNALVSMKQDKEAIQKLSKFSDSDKEK